MNLRVPGPTPIPPSVREATSRQMINHRGPEFRDLLNSVNEGLKRVFQTRNDVITITASGTGGLEAAVLNVLSPGERTMVVTVGEFGDRVVKLCETFGVNVRKVAAPPGQPADPDTVRLALKEEPRVNTVFVTHNETSTGITNDLASLSGVIKGEFGKNLVVDGISSISSIPCPVDEWGIDVAISGSQKGWMAPPGLSMLSVSPKAWDIIRKSTMPRFYFDLVAAQANAKNGMTPWTPAVSLIYALQEGLRLLLLEGMDNVYKRHAGLAAMVRDGVQSQGLQLFAKTGFQSNTVTAVAVPEGVQWAQLSELLLKEHSVALAGGQGALSGKVFRIGHMGWVSGEDLEDALSALKATVSKLLANGR